MCPHPIGYLSPTAALRKTALGPTSSQLLLGVHPCVGLITNPISPDSPHNLLEQKDHLGYTWKVRIHSQLPFGRGVCARLFAGLALKVPGTDAVTHTHLK